MPGFKTRLSALPSIDHPKFLDFLVEILAWTHHRFLWIHPFKDYNGRIARLIINIILLNLNLPPIELRVETRTGRERYIKALQAADNVNYKKLQKLLQSAIEEAAREFSAK